MRSRTPSASTPVRPACWADSTVTLTKGDQTVKATQLMKLMNLGVKAGDEVTIGVEGGDEDAALAALEAFMKENL